MGSQCTQCIQSMYPMYPVSVSNVSSQCAQCIQSMYPMYPVSPVGQSNVSRWSIQSIQVVKLVIPSIAICPQTTVFVTNRVPMAPFGPKLSQNEAHRPQES